tara:strand:- start:47 stop:322 length:276 start_codon:yes stop_codon:yes gene_type:complete
MLKYAITRGNKVTLFDIGKCNVCHREGKVDKSFKTVTLDKVGMVHYISQGEMDAIPMVYFKHDKDGLAYDLMCARCGDAIFEGVQEKRVIE